MIGVHVLGSSSKGNGYVIDCDGERMILECGCPWKDALRACRYDVSSIAGCLVTHSHDDHARFVPEYIGNGVKVLALDDVLVRKKVHGMANAKAVVPGMGYKVGNFTVQPLKAFHDVDTVSFVIFHKKIGRVVFATDTCQFPYKIPKVSLWMIEANYSSEIVGRRLGEGKMSSFMVYRLDKTHMEISKTVKVLRSHNYMMDRSRDFVFDCILLHLSDENSNAVEFKDRAFREGRMKPVVAETGMVIDLAPIAIQAKLQKEEK